MAGALTAPFTFLAEFWAFHILVSTILYHVCSSFRSPCVRRPSAVSPLFYYTRYREY